MRGKLRDKRVENKRNRFKRDLVEHRRPAKRESRTSFLLNLQWEEDYQSETPEELLVVAEKTAK